MPDENLDMQRVKELLDEIKSGLAYTTEEGKVIKITEAFKIMPHLQEKFADLDKRFTDLETKARERKWADMPGLEDEKKKFSFFRLFNAIATKDWSEAEFEREVCKEARKRALGTSDDTAGGYLVPVQAFPEFVEMLRAESVCLALGARILDGLSGSPVEIPKQTGGATAYWVGDNSSITDSTQATGQITLTPKKCAALTKLSNDLMKLSNPSAEAMVREDVARVIGLAVDLGMLRGSGQSNQPTGIANTGSINTYTHGSGGNGAVLANMDWAYDMEYELAVDNAMRGKTGFVFHPAIKRNIKKLKVAQYSGDTGGEYMVLPPPTDVQIEAWLGHPFKTTTQLPINLTAGNDSNCTEIYFANWQELILGQWAGMEILASNEAGDAFQYDQTWIRIITLVDVGVRHAESFCLANDVKIAA